MTDDRFTGRWDAPTGYGAPCTSATPAGHRLKRKEANYWTINGSDTVNGSKPPAFQRREYRLLSVHSVLDCVLRLLAGLLDVRGNLITLSIRFHAFVTGGFSGGLFDFAAASSPAFPILSPKPMKVSLSEADNMMRRPAQYPAVPRYGLPSRPLLQTSPQPGAGLTSHPSRRCLARSRRGSRLDPSCRSGALPEDVQSGRTNAAKLMTR